MTDQVLKESFHKDMIALCQYRSKEIKYKSSRLLELINKYGGYEAALKHVVTDMNIFEFTLLWEQERLDLSIESLVTKEIYKSLFSEAVFDFCDRRLKEYNYAPKRIEKEEEVSEISHWVDDLFDILPNKEGLADMSLQTNLLNYTVDVYKEGNLITVEQWKNSFMDDKVFSEKNRDMAIRMHLMGGRHIQAEDLAKEEGYSSNYPYDGVTTALGKRLKNAFKLETPKSNKGNLIWWPILFTGFFIDNSKFSLSLRKALGQAIKELIEEGCLDTSTMTIQTHKIYLEEEMCEEILQEPLTTAKEILNEKDIAQENIKVSVKEDVAIETLMSRMFEDEVAQDTLVDQTTVESIKAIEFIENVVPVITLESLKKDCIDYYGAICEICGFDYSYIYGDAFEGFIDVHNIKGEDEPKDLIGIDPHKDLIPVCHNCHAIIHSQKSPYTLRQMKSIMKAQKS